MFYDNVKRISEKRGISISALMTLAGLRPANATQWKKRGTTPSGETVKRLADVLNCTSEDLLAGEIKAEIGFPPEAIPIRRKTWPKLGTVNCGEPNFEDAGYDTYEAVDREIDADYVLEAKGDSMIGARIHSGDIVFIKQMQTVDNGQIAAVSVNGETTLKRVYWNPDRQELTLRPENPAFPALYFTGSELEQIHILGRAVAVEFRVK